DRGDEVRNHHLREMVQLAKADALIGQRGQQGRQGSLGALGGSMRGDAPMKAAPPPPMAAPTPTSRMAMQTEVADAMKITTDLNQTVEGQISTRINFDALAYFAASLPTDANGRASVKVKLPDNLTRYRVMAVAVAGEKQFGIGESTITAR